MTSFEKEYSLAISFLEDSGISSPNKPAIPHCRRVAQLLYEKGYRGDVIVAALCHDLLEWSDAAAQDIKVNFGSSVLSTVSSLTKDRFLSDSSVRRKDQVDRMRAVGDEAILIKLADTIDSFYYYRDLDNKNELTRCTTWIELLTPHLSAMLKEQFENELDDIDMYKKSL